MANNELTQRYLMALKAVARGHKRSTGMRRIPERERGSAKLHAKWAAESPVYESLVTGKKVPRPSDEELKKRKHFHALKDIVRSYKSGWMRKKVAPDHRESIKEQARSLAESKGTHFLPRATEERLATATALKKRYKLALVDGVWYRVDHVKNETGGRPSRKKAVDAVFLGVSMGYDMGRYVVIYDDGSEDEAIETAMNEWPHMFYEDIKTLKQHAKLEETDPEEAERYMFIESIGKMGIPESNIWVHDVTEYTGGAIKIQRHANIYRLPNGDIVEAK